VRPAPRRPPVRARRGGLASGAAALVLAACGGGTTVTDTVPAAAAGYELDLPAHFPLPRVPDDNPLTEAKVELGRFLFFDRRLSGNGLQSCGSCHRPELAFTDGRTNSLGSTGAPHPRGAQPLANVAYNTTLTWANPALVTLEAQMAVPLFGTSPVEMGLNDGNKAKAMQRLRSDATYPAQFAAAFPADADPFQWGNVIKAIASFQRTLISGRSKYDQYQQGQVVLSASEERGRVLFFGEKAECFHCHASFNFNDQVVHAGSRPGLIETPFHNTGLYNIDGKGGFPAPNRGVFESSFAPTDMGKFRAQSLRNVGVTAPYMHDGSIATLKEVLDFYAAGGRNVSEGPLAGDGRANPFKSGLVTLIRLDEQDKADLVAFLLTLTDVEFINNPKHADPFATR
jgi:cytochrome c peroxidase